MNGEGAIVAESRPRKRADACRSSAEMAPTAAEVRMAAEMPSTTTAEVGMTATAAMEMSAAAMTTATVAAATMTAAASRRGISGGRQHGHQNKSGNPSV
jgi:hypothetical protein